MDNITPYLAPPFVGAFIGYMTNYVAIRMLFRPLRPWRILGIRVPMTPGVIPSKRHDLAENIGRMVGGHLLTSKDVSKALTEEGFQNELLDLIEERVENLLEKELGPVASLVPKRFRSYFEVGVKVMRLRFLEHLHAHIDGDVFAESLAPSISQQFQDFLATPTSSLLPQERLDHLHTFLESTIAGFLSGQGVQEWIGELINRAVDDFLDNDGSLADLLPAGVNEALMDKLAQETPLMLAKLAELLEDPEVQRKVAKAISGAINNFASSMGPLVSLVSNFINPQKIEQKVVDYLAENSDSIAQWLFDPAVQGKITAILHDKTKSILATPLKNWIDEIDGNRVHKARQWIIERILITLQSPELAKSISGLVRQGLETQQQRSLQEITVDLFGEESIRTGSAWITNEIIATLRSPKVKRMLDELVTTMVDQRLLQQPLGKLSAFLPKEVQEGIAGYLLEQVSDILVREVPGLVDSLNIKEIVARKVDSLDLLRLEGLLLSIMQEQFKYINLFGGLLGFIIGLANLVFLIGG